jgi:hypothetical protein
MEAFPGVSGSCVGYINTEGSFDESSSMLFMAMSFGFG